MVRSSAVVDVGEEQAVVVHWPHIPTFRLLQLCLYRRIQVCHCEDLVLEVVRHVAHVAVRRPRVKSTLPNVMVQLLPPHTKVEVVVAVLQAPVVVVVTVLEAGRPRLQLQPRLQLPPPHQRRTSFLHPQLRVTRLHRRVLVPWLALN